MTRVPRPARSPRGAALLTVIAAIAVLTALAVNVAYDTRVSLESAANARDELRAEYLARSGVTVSRVIVYFQQQVDAQLEGMRRAAGNAMPVPRIQLWNLVPVSSAFLDAVFGAPAAGDGTFEAKLEDEDRKVNAQMDGLPGAGGLEAAQLASFFQLVGDPRWDFLFDREDENGVKTTREDLAIRLHDWTDENETGSALNGLAFESGFGDENYLYDRGAGDDRYRAKNARFDSLEELYLVAGVSDAFMAAFGDRLTVYVGRNSKMNVNTPDPIEMLRNAGIMADPPNQAVLSDPGLPARIGAAVSDLTLGGFLALSVQQFAQILESQGIRVNAMYQQQRNADQRGAFGDRSYVFRIRASGTANGVKKDIDAVVTTAPDMVRAQQSQPAGPQAQLGLLLRWHEE
jgi:general secretion pathway protein K